MDINTYCPIDFSICYNICSQNMYKITDNKSPQSDNQKKQKIVRTLVTITCTLLVVLLILLLVFLILKNQQNNQNKKQYTSIFDASLVTDASSLDNKSFTVSSPTNDDAYLVSVVMNTTTSNASLGNFATHDYLYSIYDGNPNNVLTLTLLVKDNSNNTSVSDKLSDIVFTIELGDKDNHSPITLDKADDNTRTATYSSTNDIKIYSISVNWFIAL